LTSPSSGNESADAGAAVVIAHAIAHPTTARATFSLASSIHDVEFARAVTLRRARPPLVVEVARDDVDARGRIVVVIPACVIVIVVARVGTRTKSIVVRDRDRVASTRRRLARDDEGRRTSFIPTTIAI